MTVAAVFLAGLIVGFLTGLALRNVIDMVPHPRRFKMPDRPRRPRVPSARILIGVLLIVTVALNAVVGALLIQQRAANARYTECAATWQQDFSLAYRVRSDAAAEVSQAVDATFAAVASQDPDAFAAAVQLYVKVRARQEQQKAKNPLPAPPQKTCGKPKGQ